MKKKGNRVVVLIAGMAIQLCTGILYMWSVFQQYLQEKVHLGTVNTKMVSSVMLAFFVVGIVFGGRISDKIGTRKVVATGSVLFALSLLLSSFTLPNSTALLYVTYGVLGGVGVGAAYNSSIACVTRWFPTKRGFATGMIVGAFGFSIVLFAPLTKSLLASIGMPSVLRIFSLVFLVVCLSASFFMQDAPEQVQTNTAVKTTKKQYTTREMLKTPQFYMLTIAMMFITPAFFILNPIFVEMGLQNGLDENTATLAVMITGIASAAGRLIMPWVSDKIGRKGGILTISLLTLVSMVVLAFAPGKIYILLITLISFAYGGSSGVFPPYASDLFGTKHAGENYGFVMVGFGISAITFPLLSEVINSSGASGSYTFSFLIAAATSVLAMISILLLKPMNKEAVTLEK